MPCGYRFRPSDEELIIHFLKPKNLNQPLPNNIIKTVNLYQYTPQQLFDMYKEKVMYFFTLRNRQCPGKGRKNRAAGNGYWRITTTETPIGNKDQPIAYKTTLGFHEGTYKDPTKTDWLMHEYAPTTSKAQQEMKMDGWVLCRVYKKSAKKGNDPMQSNLKSPLPVESLPLGLHYVNSQRPTHSGESSFSKPQVDQKPLVSVRPLPPGLHDLKHLKRPAHSGESSFSKPQVDQKPRVPVRPHPPGLHDFNHLKRPAHSGGCSVPMVHSNQDRLSTRPPPSEMHNTYSWMPGNSGQTYLDQPRFQNVNSQMASHSTGESCYPKPPPDQPGFLNVNSQMAAHNTGESCYPEPLRSQGPLLVNNVHPSGMYNPDSHMPQFHNTGESCYPNPLWSQDPLLLNNDHPSGMYNTDSHMPQLPPLSPTIPHLSGMFNLYAQLCGNTGHDCFPNSQTNQHPPLSKRPRLSGMHNIVYTGNFWFPEQQSNKEFMPPTRPGPHYTDSQITADVQQSCYPESPPRPDSDHDSNHVPSFEHHNNRSKAEEEVSSELARDKPPQHG